MIRNILFDFDGTLVDSAPGIVKTMEQTFLQMGVPVPAEAEMRATIGLPLRQALQMLGKLSDSEADRATELYRELFPIYEVGYIRVFEGVEQTLRNLRDRGFRMAIVTSRDTLSLDMVADKRGLSPFFETRVTGADGHAPKPAPDMVHALLERMGILPGETLVVGDTTFDIEMGNRAGCHTCAVTYGNHSREQLLSSSPRFLIDHISSLPECIDNVSSVLFVCHGNICRSVMAEMVMKHLVAEEGAEWVIDSCATSTEEIGNDIYPPAKRCLERHHVPYTHHAARQMTRQDFERYDRIYCMDQNNLRNIRRMFGDELASRVKLLMSLVGDDRDVADPWYTGDFEATYRDVVAGCEQIRKMHD